MSTGSWLPNLFGRDRHPVTESFGSLQREINRLFDEFGSLAPWTVPMDSAARVVPKIDLTEADGSFVVTAELPGVEQGDIDVKLADNVLTIKGEKKAESEKTDQNVHLVERRYGSFQRSLTLPAEVVADQVSAQFDKGVLKITLPKAPEAARKEKKIEIGSAA